MNRNRKILLYVTTSSVIIIFILLIMGGRQDASYAEPNFSERSVDYSEAPLLVRRKGTHGGVEAPNATVYEAQQASRPLAELSPTPEQSKLLYEAEEAALVTCMNERGLEYYPNSYSELDGQKNGPAMRDNMEEVDMSADSSMQSIPEEQSIPERGANDDLLAGMSPIEQEAWMTAFSGGHPDPSSIPNGGPWVAVELPEGSIIWNTESCLASATRAVFGDDIKKAWNDIRIAKLFGRISALSEKDEHFRESQKKWQECMADSGHKFRSRGEVWDYLFQHAAKATIIDTDLIRQQELEIKTADQMCAQISEIYQIRAAAEQRAEASVRAEKPDEISALKNDLDAAITRAEALLSSDQF